MIFLTSLIYALLLFVVPGELALMGLAAVVPGIPTIVALVGLNLLAYGVVFALVYVSRKAYRDFSIGEHQAQEVRLADWLEINRCRWLNYLGLAGISAGAFILASTGRLALPFWFLYAAIVVGLLDILKKDRLVTIPSDLPAPRFDPTTATIGKNGKKVEFAWRAWSADGLAGDEFQTAFLISDAEYQRARGQGRYPTRDLENYVRYVQEQFGNAVREVAAYFRQQSEEKEFTAVQELGNVVCFARAIVYADDQNTRGVPDWANYPIETLYDQAGDCEDHAILTASILHHLGHNVALFFLQFDDGAHLALGYEIDGGAGPFSGRARNGRDYFYVETVPTSDAERIGDIAEQFLRRIKETTVIAVE